MNTTLPPQATWYICVAMSKLRACEIPFPSEYAAHRFILDNNLRGVKPRLWDGAL